ncbi:hypothetical protein GC102_02040 [Paenibacillus sp. LMG 31460]|uniref:Uncharacterized protein n=1 Tax=Paenibacillus germinis TaxID=2654979 RepID=A0ABX1YXW3_9BACL|nr:hypothetical protein [Paenibacillus germinis]NOU84560.1 hypothetical protein [Paenibacillus germinis]
MLRNIEVSVTSHTFCKGIHSNFSMKRRTLIVFLQVHLFGYNNIDVKESFEKSFKQLLNEDEVAILGGITFFEDEDKFILPSCCCGLEDLVLVNESIINRVSPWLGHDPNPGIKYSNNGIVKVWSDDQKEENCQ